MRATGSTCGSPSRTPRVGWTIDLEALGLFADRYSDSEAFLGEITPLAELSGEDNDVN